MTAEQRQDVHVTQTRRRTYNRRAEDVSPPYFDTFNRIALALEGIERALRGASPLDPESTPEGTESGKKRAGEAPAPRQAS